MWVYLSPCECVCASHPCGFCCLFASRLSFVNISLHLFQSSLERTETEERTEAERRDWTQLQSGWMDLPFDVTLPLSLSLSPPQYIFICAQTNLLYNWIWNWRWHSVCDCLACGAIAAGSARDLSCSLPNCMHDCPECVCVRVCVARLTINSIMYKISQHIFDSLFGKNAIFYLICFQVSIWLPVVTHAHTHTHAYLLTLCTLTLRLFGYTNIVCQLWFHLCIIWF